MRRLGLGLLAALAAALLAAAPASAAFGVSEFDIAFEEEDGTMVTQAGSHPFQMRTDLLMNTVFDPGFGAQVPDRALKDFTVELPVGMVGDIYDAPRCSSAGFAAVREVFPNNEIPDCPDSTAVGTVAAAAVQAPPRLYTYAPLYNLVPPPGYVAKLGFFVHQVPVFILVGLREAAPNRAFATIQDASQVLLVYGARLTVWGNPADPRHDPYRGNCLKVGEGTPSPDELTSLGNCPTGGDGIAFLTLPSTCTGPLRTGYRASSWPPSAAVAGTVESHDAATPPNPFGTTGCAGLGLSPTVAAPLSSDRASSPAGMDFSLKLEDSGLTDPEGTAGSALKKTVVKLPPGVTVNPSAADGQQGCSEAQLAAERATEVPGQGCPEAAKIGSVEVQTPILKGRTLHGSLFVATPYQNRFGSLIALYLVFRDPQLGILVRQEGEVEADPVTGQLTAVFDQIPPLPFSDLRVHFRTGARAPLATPPACGTYTTEVALTPWANPSKTVSRSATFTIGEGAGGGPCPTAAPPFAPSFEAGAANNAAGAYSPFHMRIQRGDGEQGITRFSAVLPPGEVAKIAGVPPCPDAAIEAAKSRSGSEELAAPSCPAASKIGTVVGGAGVGSALTYVPGSLYLAGPYGGDQVSVVAIVPAVAGPFDVGTVVIRVGLKLNPETGEAEVDSAASDPIPQILKGIPLSLRDLRVNIDRPQFSLNPTSCKPLSTRAQVFGTLTSAAVAARYQASSCASLGFKPNLKLQMTGQTKRSGHPRLHSVVTYPKGGEYANIGRAVVILPHSAFIDPERVANPCTRPQFAEGRCPKASRLGWAKAYTPLLDQPLQGPVYFRSNGGARKIPDIVADLNGQFHIVLLGKVDSVDTKRDQGSHTKLRTIFDNVPDARVSRFVLNLKGGSEGVIENSQNLCHGTRHAQVKLRGQNGRLHDFKTKLHVKACGKKKAKKRVRRRPAG